MKQLSLDRLENLMTGCINHLGQLAFIYSDSITPQVYKDNVQNDIRYVLDNMQRLKHSILSTGAIPEADYEKLTTIVWEASYEVHCHKNDM